MDPRTAAQALSLLPPSAFLLDVGPRSWHYPPMSDPKFCAKCREVKSVEEFPVCRASPDGHGGYCRFCVGVINRKRKKLNPSESLWYSARRRARSADLSFTISVRDITIPSHCPVFGFKLEVGAKNRRRSPSLDRIDNSRGYEPDNIVVVSNWANELKRDMTLSQMQALLAFYGPLLSRNSGSK